MHLRIHPLWFPALWTVLVSYLVLKKMVLSAITTYYYISSKQQIWYILRRYYLGSNGSNSTQQNKQKERFLHVVLMHFFLKTKVVTFSMFYLSVCL